MKLSLANIPLTQELVRHLFNYNPETGILRWRNPTNTKIRKGAIAGSKTYNYYRVNIYNRNYRLHRIIWLYVHGYFPENEIDHIDRNGQNNKLNNLREVSRQCNLRNTGLYTTNKSGITGVYFDKTRFTWCAFIRVNGKLYNLGCCFDYIEAACTRLAAEQCLDWSNCNTNSTAYQCVKEWLIKSKCLEESYA